MPIVQIYGVHVRSRAVLNAIGAQEALEHWANNPPHVLAGKARQAQWERERLTRAARRNRAESRLRPEERAAWGKWRSADANEREAVRAVLTDLPTNEEAGDATTA